MRIAETNHDKDNIHGASVAGTDDAGLIEKFIAGSCDAVECSRVARFLEGHPHLIHRVAERIDANAKLPHGDFKEISYIIDTDDRLVWVNAEWTEFALKNDGREILPENVIGRSLWDFITDDPTKELYHALVDQVRTGQPVELVIRCDASERRRLIEMGVTQQPDGQVEFKTVLLASKPRAPQRLFAKSTPRDARHILVCSWCDMVNVDVEKWFEVEAAMEYLQLTDAPELPSINPVVCPTCYEKVIEILGKSPKVSATVATTGKA